MKRLTPLLVGLIGLCAFQVQAHTRLSAATPANETVTEAAPKEIVLEFNADVRLLAVTLEKSGEQTIELGPLPDGNQQLFTVAVLADLSAGDYLVSWRAVGADTHTVSGEIHFAVTGEESLASRLSADH